MYDFILLSRRLWETLIKVSSSRALRGWYNHLVTKGRHHLSYRGQIALYSRWSLVWVSVFWSCVQHHSVEGNVCSLPGMLMVELSRRTLAWFLCVYSFLP